MLRGINVGGNKLVKMDRLRSVYESLGFRDVQTYLQSGNVIFRADAAPAVSGIEVAIERAFGFHSDVINRTAEELRAVVAANPFEEDFHPSKLLVTFLARKLTGQELRAIAAIRTEAEDVRPIRSEIYTYYRKDMGRSKLPALLGKAVTVTGTSRNWNTVRNLLRLAEL
jgi:uncharacterized protein (DUF1697 family)